MTGDTVDAANAAYRRRRVKRIKRIIIGICITLLVLPTILSVFLMIKVFSLEKEIQTISENKTKTEETTEVAKAKDKESTASPTATAAATAEPQTKRVYLTFDDGPGVQTSKILDILKKEKVKATFFVTGKEDAAEKKLYKRIVKEGHTLGLHSYSHIYDVVYDSKKAFKKDLDQLYDYLYDVTGVHAKYYRFPGGSSTQSTDLPIQTFIDVLDEKGLTYLDWNVISPDIGTASVTKAQMVKSILEGVEQYDTSIVLMYDVADKPMTVKALPSIIKALKAEKYELLAVDEDTPLIQHNHEN